jgi:hypothetical protein
MVLMVLGFLSFSSVFFQVLSPQDGLGRVSTFERCYTSTTRFSSPALKDALGMPECGSLEHRFAQYTSNPAARALGGLFLS